MKNWIATLTVMMATGPALAQDSVLLMGTERYRAFDRVVQGADVLDAARAFADQGYTVLGEANPGIDELRQNARRWLAQAEDADRLIAVLSGTFVTDGHQTWYMASDAREPTLFDVAVTGLSLDAVTRVLERTQGQALLVLAADPDHDTRFEDGLQLGIGPFRGGDGVTIVTGEPRYVADFLQQVVAVDGSDVAGSVRTNRRLQLSGFAPAELRLGVPDNAGETRNADLVAEGVMWRGAEREDTIEAYRGYLQSYPQGRFAADARQAISAIQNEPNRAARLAEEGLGLSRDARRDIQRDLAILDFDTRGIDGIFGNGTRQAITNWQQQNGFGQTGYLTGNQINRLDAQAARRSQELAAAAERQRQAEAQRDRAYWSETGEDNTEAGVRAYLERYPDGQFAETARDRLDEIEDEKRRRAAVADREQWDRSREADSIAGYQRYLEQFPRGDFADSARARIGAIEQAREDAASNSDAAQAETALNLDPITRRLVEAQLQRLGREPGRVDGDFDEATRRAIRRFQRDNGMRVTGFLNQNTVVRLLAENN